jgi:hypothetical protein
MVSKLPRGLLTLKGLEVLTQEPIDNLLRALPSGLTHLYIGGTRDLSVSETALLPRSLISMPSLERYTIATDAIPLLPPLLTSQVKISESHPSLTSHTGLRELCCLTEDSFKAFPPNLKLLFLSSGTLSAEQLPHLPASLEVLRVSFCRISGEDWSLLPRRLTCFTSEGGSFHLTRSITELFPRTLTSLRLPNVHLDEDDCLDGLPSTLMDLQIIVSNGLSALLVSWDHLPNLSTLSTVITYAPTKGFFTSLFPLLPKRLQSLTLQSDSAQSDSELQNENMALLPRGIYMLCLPKSSPLNKDCLKYLPPNLREFRAGDRAVKFFKQIF